MEEVKFAECGDLYHKWNGSIYPKERVPQNLFIGVKGKICKACIDCRTKKAAYMRTWHERKRVIASITTDLTYNCPHCNAIRTKDHCEKCKKHSNDSYQNNREGLKRLKLEKILEIGYCCQQCKKVFIKQANGKRFLTVDSLLNVSYEDIEYFNIEFDHLTEKEQIAMYGISYGPKSKNVSDCTSYASQKAEAMKCQILCIYCHRLKTHAVGPIEKYRPVKQQKVDYVKGRKIEIGKCAVCDLLVTENNLQYFEFDHLDPSKKYKSISLIVTNTSKCNSLNILKSEIEKCRLLCAYCHRIHTIYQRQQTNIEKHKKLKC